jgi:thymidylate synthase (FAD)
MNLKGEELIDELAKINESVCIWKNQLKNAETCYMHLINDTKGSKLKPQEARGVLPNDCMTELIITGDLTAWKHFFDLRCARAAHPDIRVLAWKIVDKFVELGYILEEERLNYIK